MGFPVVSGLSCLPSKQDPLRSDKNWSAPREQKPRCSSARDVPPEGTTAGQCLSQQQPYLHWLSFLLYYPGSLQVPGEIARDKIQQVAPLQQVLTWLAPRVQRWQGDGGQGPGLSRLGLPQAQRTQALAQDGCQMGACCRNENAEGGSSLLACADGPV